MQTEKQKWQRNVLIGSSEVCSCLQGAWKSGPEAIARWWTHLCYWDKESTCGWEHPDHLECLSGLVKSGEAFDITNHCMPQLLFFLSFLFFLTSMLSDLLSAFWCLCSHQEETEDWGVQSSCAWPSSLSCFLFVSLPLYFFLKKYVLLLCLRLEFLFSSSLFFFPAFNCFGAFVFPWTWAQWKRSTVSEAWAPLIRLSILHWSLHCCRGKRQRSLKGRKGNPCQVSGSAMWALSSQSTTHLRAPLHGQILPRASSSDSKTLTYMWIWADTLARSLGKMSKQGSRLPASWRLNFWNPFSYQVHVSTS